MTRESVGDFIQRFRQAISQSVIVGRGIFSKSSDSAFIEIVDHTGFDFVVLNLKHGPNIVQTSQDLTLAAAVADLFPIVRAKAHAPAIRWMSAFSPGNSARTVLRLRDSTYRGGRP